jgi:hypothetical protein
MSVRITQLGSGQVTLAVLAGLLLVAVSAAALRHSLHRRGRNQPLVVRFITRAQDKAISLVKRPITAAVLDEVAEVLRTGHYTRNIASALRENHDEIKAMVAEKITADPTIGRIGLLPLHERIIDEVTETTLRVVLAVLADPRTDELFSDLLRYNVEQIGRAVRGAG